MKYRISEIVDSDLKNSFNGESIRVKDILDVFPKCSFPENIEYVTEEMLYAELLRADKGFADKISGYIRDYREFGFCLDGDAFNAFYGLVNAVENTFPYLDDEKFNKFDENGCLEFNSEWEETLLKYEDRHSIRQNKKNKRCINK